ncbi:hAT transposon superfamily [Striga asiatica]|uniref:HAT transposon superfamily n=1 Tax=Striga asiatica TaxID=4170 RepID=A0A5A7QDW3_STRAF|nr:hAT transposon superfamily [Striga asiatica]
MTMTMDSQKRPRQTGPMDMYLTADKGKQTTINEAWKKEFRVKVCMAISEWMYDAAIPFNALTYPSFQNMLNHIGQYGLGLQGPSMYEARVPFLSKAVEKVDNDYIKLCKEEGTVFLESIDASSYAKTGRKMFELIDKFVERIGESNVIQVVTDNASAMVLAGKLLQDKRPHLFWTPCAAHCVDLILEDIGKLPYIKDTLKKAMSVNAYVYVHSGVVNTLRHFTGEKELVRAGVTRFATAFLTLERMQILKEKLRDMFRSRQWEESQWKKEVVHVLRMVDGEKRPTMGYIYEAMDKAKEAIRDAFDGKEDNASGCERNWSIFEHVHSKKRNRLDKKRLNDLVYVKYNRALRLRYDGRDRIDPILLNEIKESNEWLLGKMEGESDGDDDDLVFEGEDLTWDAVAKASGAEEPTYRTREKAQSSKSKEVDKGKGKVIDLEKRKSIFSRKGSSLRLIDEDEEFVEDDLESLEEEIEEQGFNENEKFNFEEEEEEDEDDDEEDEE